MDSAAHALHLYPTALARDAALDALPAAAWTDRHLTFPEFAIELERLLPPLPGKPGVRGANELAGAACYGLLLQALHDASFKAERERFGSDAALRAAAALLAGWKGAALTPQDVSAAAVRLPRGCEARETLQFLARLYAASERLLASSGWTDREGREQGLLARLDRAAALPAQLLPRGAPLEAHGFHRLVLFQRRVLERVAALGHPVRLHLPCAPAHDPSEGLLRTFGPLRPSHAVPAIAPPREQLRIEAATPYDEVYEIGRRIRRWITDDNVPPAAIALAFRDLGAYSQFVSDVFKRFGIPFYERRGEPAAFQPVVRVALSAVAACANGLPRADLFRFLCSGVVHVAALAGRPGEEVDAGALHKLALDARIDRFFGDEARQPAKAWAARLERYARTSKDTDARAVAVLCAAVERLDGMRDERSARDHALAWKTLFGEAGLSRAALLRGEGPGPDQHKDRLAVAELEQALDAIAASPFAAGARITLEEFQRLLSLEIAEHFVRAEGSARGGVRVLNLYDLRGLHFQKLIIGGMAEGSFPAAQTPDPLLGGGCEHDLRGALARGRETDLLYVEPRLKDECGEEERALFDIACAAAAGATLVFTRPCVSVEGRPVEPSVFWDTDAKAQPEKAAAISPAPPLSQCITAEEVELRAAWVLGGGAARGGPLTSDSLRSSRPSPHGGEEDEGPAAAACFARTPRLRNLAHLAAIERHRQRFFAWQGSAKEIGGHDSPTAGERIAAGPYDGMVALTAPEAAAAVAEMVLVQASSREIGVHDSQFSPSGRPPMTELGSCPPISQPLSPSALEALAACPFCFLAEKLWHYKEADEPEEELSALDKGGLWHTLLATFYREQLDAARKAGRLVACLDAGQKARYLARLRDIAKQLLADAPARVFVGPPGLWNLQREQIEAALEAWLNHELFLCSDKEKAFHPAEVEFSFGARSSHRVPPVNVPIVLPGEIGGHDSQFSPSGRPRMTELGSCPPISLTYVLPLEGRLDRLDLRLDDPDSAQPLVTAVRVLDYKLGRSANHKDDVKEEVLSALLAAQLPVYLKAAMEFVKALETQKRVRVDWGKVWQESQAAYYCLRDIPSRLRGKKPALLAILKWPGPDLRAFLSGDDTIAAGSLFDAVRTKVLEMLQGHFPVHPPECRSTSCAARFVCRYQAVPAESDTGEGGRKRGGS